jgi:hypothetical protein
MNWRIRVLFYGAIVALCVAVVFVATHKSERLPADPVSSSEVVSNENSPEQLPDVSYPAAADRAQVPTLSADIPSALATAPREDLLFTGFSGLGSNRYAMFAITRPDEADFSFMLQEREQNEWLEVLSIDPQNGTVKVILKKPVVRIRNTGVEVILSFEIHGRKSDSKISMETQARVQ